MGSLTSTSIELVKTLRQHSKHRINIACIKETRWTSAKAREIDGHKSWYTGLNILRNGVGIIVDLDSKDQVVTTDHKGDHIITIRLAVGQKLCNVVSVYIPKVGLDEDTK